MHYQVIKDVEEYNKFAISLCVDTEEIDWFTTNILDVDTWINVFEPELYEGDSDSSSFAEGGCTVGFYLEDIQNYKGELRVRPKNEDFPVLVVYNFDFESHIWNEGGGSVIILDFVSLKSLGLQAIPKP